jgi:hypothetical protein
VKAGVFRRQAVIGFPINICNTAKLALLPESPQLKLSEFEFRKLDFITLMAPMEVTWESRSNARRVSFALLRPPGETSVFDVYERVELPKIAP